MLSKEQAMAEARVRMEALGIEEEAIREMEAGGLPLDLQSIDNPWGSEFLSTVAGALEKEAPLFVYGILGGKIQDMDALFFLVVNRNEEEWHYPHEMKNGTNPIVFALVIDDPDESYLYYADLQDPKNCELILPEAGQ